LARSGVRVPAPNIKTVSYMAPTACNDSDAGKAKNRSAEVASNGNRCRLAGCWRGSPSEGATVVRPQVPHDSSPT
jgi:hypothetical protein